MIAIGKNRNSMINAAHTVNATRLKRPVPNHSASNAPSRLASSR